MSLKWIAILLGILGVIGGLVGIIRPKLVERFAELFPRSVVPAWILTALCCGLGAREALEMNMGFLDSYKVYIYVLAPAVFVASLVYLKELLAPRALGGFLLLISVPIIRTATLSNKPMFQVVVTVMYLLIIYGLVLMMSPWWFRKFYQAVLGNKLIYKVAVVGKVVLGVALIALGMSVY